MSADVWMTDPRLSAEVAEHPYPLLFATVSGAHLYGFPSPDSDFDLRGSHILPIDECLGLHNPAETISLAYVRDGVEVDRVTHDVRKFFSLLVRNNGYVLEQLYSPLVVWTSPYQLDRLQAPRPEPVMGATASRVRRQVQNGTRNPARGGVSRLAEPHLSSWWRTAR